MIRRRDRTDIEADILRVVRESGEAGVTRIVYRCNLNFTLVREYLDRLVLAGLLAKRGTCYTTTPAGEAFLERYYELRALLTGKEDPELRLLQRFHEPL